MHRNEVCGIVVTFHPDAGFPARLRGICSQVGILIVVDNGSADAEVRMLADCTAHSGVKLVLNAANLGIARALNIGIQQAMMLGYRWALLLDQDSRGHDDQIDTLLAALQSYPEKERLAVIGSGWRDSPRGSAGPDTDATSPNLWDEVEWVITSGSLLSLAAYSSVGPFREEFFIDYVDLEWCIRARARGYCIINTRRLLMSHAIGAPTQHRLLWMQKSTTNHSADRRYYRARNDTVMLREYGNYNWGSWAIKSLARSFRTCKRILLYEDSKESKIVAVIQGWWDGVRGNLGVRRKKT
jgi:rhamnosyltransferase